MSKYLFFFFAAIVCTNTLLAQYPVGTGIRHYKDLQALKDDQGETRKILDGYTPELADLEIHETKQKKDAIPDSLYKQEKKEQLIFITEGKLKCYIAKDSFEIGQGSALLIPPMVNQRLVNTGDGTLNYYVIQFQSKNNNIPRSDSAGGALVLNFKNLANEQKQGKGNRKYLDGPSAMTKNLEMHMTTLSEKGFSHAGHRHVDSEIIILLEGDVSMDIEGSHFIGAKGDVFYVESGKYHRIMNDSNKVAKYLAIKWR